MVALEFIDSNPLYPCFLVNQKVLDRLCGLWMHVLVIKLLGKSVGYKALRLCMKQLCKPKGVMTILDLSNDYFLVKFDLNEDLNTIIISGP